MGVDLLALLEEARVFALPRWVATLSNGLDVHEAPEPGDYSPWRRLQSYCVKQRVYITRLRFLSPLQADGQQKVIELPQNATGYFAASGIRMQQGTLEGRVHTKGIGWVEQNTVYIVWVKSGANYTTKEGIYREMRPVQGHKNIIWAQPLAVGSRHGIEKDVVMRNHVLIHSGGKL